MNSSKAEAVHLQKKTKTKNDWCVSPFFRIKSQAQLRQIISEEVHRIYFNLIWNSEIEFELAPEMAQNRYASSRKKQNETKQKKKKKRDLIVELNRLLTITIHSWFKALMKSQIFRTKRLRSAENWRVLSIEFFGIFFAFRFQRLPGLLYNVDQVVMTFVQRLIQSMTPKE